MRDMRDENRFGWRDDDREFDQYGQGEYGRGQGYQGNYGQGGYGPESKYGQAYGQGTYSQGEWNRASGRGYGQGRGRRFGSGDQGWRGNESRGSGWRGSEWHGTDWRSGENANPGQTDQGTPYAGFTSEWDENRGRFAGRGPKGYRRSDERIREDVSDRLTDDSWLDASNIEVTVESGMVTLTGNVGSRDDKRRAEDIAMSCSGVKDVINQIHVDQSILDQVADAFSGKKADETRERTTASR